ncbi:MAG: AAA family ATPase [Candidatus Omnitrophota bacterium]
MSYLELFGLKKEPFSTSPDPDFFYLSKCHERALTNSLIEIRLKRGLSVVLGDIGTGKTTLSRKLIQELKKREDIIFNLIFDPSFEDEYSFLDCLVRNLVGPTDNNQGTSTSNLKELLEHFLFQKGVTENKTIVLIVDEAQKLNPTSLEVLRILLNYETNQFKLLQLVLLGQLELYSTIVNIPNLFDRISFKYTLNPLDEEETLALINYRLQQAGYEGSTHLFEDGAVKKIYQVTGGYPRRVMAMCYHALKKLILDNKPVIDEKIIEEVLWEERETGWQKLERHQRKDS